MTAAVPILHCNCVQQPQPAERVHDSSRRHRATIVWEFLNDVRLAKGQRDPIYRTKAYPASAEFELLRPYHRSG